MFPTSTYQSMRVMRPSNQFSIANMQVTCTTVSFNLSTASELHYPERIVILASDDGKNLAIWPWDVGSPVSIENTHPFFDKSVRPTPKRISIKDKRVVRTLRQACGWDRDKQRREVYGMYEPDYGLVYFNLSSAILSSQKKQKKSSLLSISDYPRFSQVATKMKPMLALPASGPIQGDASVGTIVY